MRVGVDMDRRKFILGTAGVVTGTAHSSDAPDWDMEDLRRAAAHYLDRSELKDPSDKRTRIKLEYMVNNHN